jgi:hypothetical protein
MLCLFCRYKNTKKIIKRSVKHWHGAAHDSLFVHLAVEVPVKSGSVDWLEPVSDEEYNKLK